MLDKGEIGGDTSSKFSRLVHGDLRYLGRLPLGLVYEVLHDRETVAALEVRLSEAKLDWQLEFTRS